MLENLRICAEIVKTVRIPRSDEISLRMLVGRRNVEVLQGLDRGGRGEGGLEEGRGVQGVQEGGGLCGGGRGGVGEGVGQGRF